MLNACNFALFEQMDCLPHYADEGLHASVQLFLILSGVSLPCHLSMISPGELSSSKRWAARCCIINSVMKLCCRNWLIIYQWKLRIPEIIFMSGLL